MDTGSYKGRYLDASKKMEFGVEFVLLSGRAAIGPEILPKVAIYGLYKKGNEIIKREGNIGLVSTSALPLLLFGRAPIINY